MAFWKSSIALWMVLAVLLTMCPAPMATVYRVGDDSGWNKYSNLFQWSYTKRFYVGDTVIFSYDNREDNVIQVNLVDYYLCNTDSPIATYDSGSESITFKEPVAYSFVSGYNQHCYDGVKVAFLVELPSHVVNTSDSIPSPSPSPNSSPPNPSSNITHNHNHTANSSSNGIDQLLDDIFFLGIAIVGILTFLMMNGFCC